MVIKPQRRKKQKRRERKKPIKTIKKMVIETYITTINLDVNGLNASTKRLTGQKNKTHIYMLSTIYSFQI